MTTVRPWCCPEPRCTPLHSLQGSEKPLSEPDPGESFFCFGKAPEVQFIYDGVEHINDVRSCTYTALKGVISFQENAEDWGALSNAYRRALQALEASRSEVKREVDWGRLADALERALPAPSVPPAAADDKGVR